MRTYQLRGKNKFNALTRRSGSVRLQPVRESGEKPRISNFIQAKWQGNSTHSKGQCGCGGTCRSCGGRNTQPKPSGLKIMPAGDRYEQEADRVAESIFGPGRLSMPARHRMSAGGNTVQRQPMEEEEPYQEAPEPIGLTTALSPEEEEPAIQRKEATAAQSVSGMQQPASQDLTQGGHQLPTALRGALEPRLGSDFSRVRVHTDAKAARWADQLHAKAFTYGQHIHFANGAYQPSRETGLRLLAHELTHVVQQGQAPRRGTYSCVGSLSLHEPVIQRSLSQAYSNFDHECECGEDLRNNCAHYLSDALIDAGYNELDGGNGALYRRRNGRIVCKAGRPVRAAELRTWFASKATDTVEGEPEANTNYWAVFQERRSDGQDHVLLHKHKEDGTYTPAGTGDYPSWRAHQTHYTW